MEDTLVRVIPHNKEAEQSIIGAMLVDKDSSISVFESVTADDFYIEANKNIFLAEQRLFDRDEPIDIITVSEELRAEDKLDAVGGIEYLAYLATTLPTTANLKQYIDIVKDKTVLRNLIRASSEILDISYAPGAESESASEEASRRIFDLLDNQSSKGIVHIKDVLIKAHEDLVNLYENKGRISGVTTGIDGLDRKLYGLQKSSLVMIAARPGVGKTSFALNIAVNAAVKENVTVAIFSLEMSSSQLISRIMSSHMLIDSDHLRSGELTDTDWDKIAVSLNELGNAPIYINDSTDVSLSDIRAKCRRLKIEKNLGLIVIDYLQLMQGPKSESREKEIAAISRSLKKLAIELDIPIVALSQLSRAVEKRADRKPMLSDLRESGSIEQDADVVIFLDREDMYNPETENKNVADCIIAKHRQGETGVIQMGWNGQFTKFMNIDKVHNE
ncbi:MAG: replicative DNA helicase [Ruminococcaceae bacterium]|nr:replicative DNA helicase [Oscillospiraceae bacterium]